MTLSPLFFYGTLRDADILTAVLGRMVSSAHLLPADASDCATVYFPGQVYPALVARPGARVTGLLLLEPTARDVMALDAFEGDQYRRGPIRVTTAENAMAAEVYWPALSVSASAADWSFDHWTQAHKPQVLERETELGQAARLGAARR